MCEHGYDYTFEIAVVIVNVIMNIIMSSMRMDTNIFTIRNANVNAYTNIHMNGTCM